VISNKTGFPAPPKKRLGDILIANGLVSQEDLEKALAEQKRSAERLGQILVSEGTINRLALSQVIAEQCGLPHIDLRKDQVDPKTAKRLNPETCRELGCIPVRQMKGVLEIAVVDPWEIPAIHERPMSLTLMRVSGDFFTVATRNAPISPSPRPR